METVVATVTKQSKNQRLGIHMTTSGSSQHGPTILSIAMDGRFRTSNLTVGMQVLSINNIEMKGVSSSDAARILKDSEGQVVVCAINVNNAGVPPQITFQRLTITVNEWETPYKVNERGTPYEVYHDVKMERVGSNAMPTILKEAGVPQETFRHIYTFIESKLMPAAGALLKLWWSSARDEKITLKQIVGGVVGFGKESNHELKTFKMSLQNATLQRNVFVIATLVKDHTNAMLSILSLWQHLR